MVPAGALPLPVSLQADVGPLIAKFSPSRIYCRPRPAAQLLTVCTGEIRGQVGDSHTGGHPAWHAVLRALLHEVCYCVLNCPPAQVESELRELPKEEAAEFLEALGVKDGGLKLLIKACYDALGLQTYFTSGEKETRAWTIKNG